MRSFFIALLGVLIIVLGGLFGFIVARTQLKDTAIKLLAPLGLNRVSIERVKKNIPQNMKVQLKDKGVQISFTTQEETISYVLITPKIKDQPDIQELLNSPESLVVVVSPVPSTTHKISIPIEFLQSRYKEEELGFYVLLEINNYLIPYGASVDMKNGPKAPFKLELTK